MSDTVTCPTCGATNPAGAPWCSLCHGSFAPPPPDPPAPPAQPPPPPRPAEATAPRQPTAEPDRQLDPDQWAALLAAEEGRRPSRFEQALSRRGAKVLFVVGVVAAVVAVAMIGLALLAQVAG